jgi:hypothetical protein
MKQFNGYADAAKNARLAGGAKLPAGAYVAKIMNVKYVPGENGNSDRIDLQFDIAEGEYKGFFKKQYEENTQEDKKWKGKTSIYVPKDDGSEKDEWTKNSFAKWTNALEDSNSKYKWDWDESKWKGLSIGLMFALTGNVIEGKEVTYTEVRYPMSVENAKKPDIKIPAIKKRNGYTGNAPVPTDNSFVTVPDNVAEEIPF